MRAICDHLDAAQIDALLRKWLAILAPPLTASDRSAGYCYDISILQAEFSLMLDPPVTGRVFFGNAPASACCYGVFSFGAMVCDWPAHNRA